MLTSCLAVGSFTAFVFHILYRQKYKNLTENVTNRLCGAKNSSYLNRQKDNDTHRDKFRKKSLTFLKNMLK